MTEDTDPTGTFATIKEPPPPPLNVYYEEDNDTVVIDGFRYAGVLFRHLGGPAEPLRWLRVVKREDGVISVSSPSLEVAESDIEKTHSDRKALCTFLANLFDDLRTEHHIEHGYTGTAAWRTHAQNRIGEALRLAGSELAPAAPLPMPADPSAPPQEYVGQGAGSYAQNDSDGPRGPGS